MDDRLVFIIETWLNGQKHLTWQYGVPPEREVIDAIVIDDIILENDNVIVDEIDFPQEPTRLIRGCTRFDCHCPDEGRRACSTYETCMRCYNSFNSCVCN